MERKIKKILSLIMCAVMLLAAVPTGAFAAEAENGGNIGGEEGEIIAPPENNKAESEEILMQNFREFKEKVEESFGKAFSYSSYIGYWIMYIVGPIVLSPILLPINAYHFIRIRLFGE